MLGFLKIKSSGKLEDGSFQKIKNGQIFDAVTIINIPFFLYYLKRTP